MKNIDDETLFKLVEEHLNKSYKESTDRIVHAGTGLAQPAQWYRDFARAVIDVALKDLVHEHEAIKSQSVARDVVPLPNERGWICKHPKYGTWFMSWAAVVKDLKQFREQFDDYNEPTEEDVDVWWREQTGWSEIESLGSQIERPDMEYLEAAFRKQMKEDPDHVSYGGSVVEHHAAITAAKEKAK